MWVAFDANDKATWPNIGRLVLVDQGPFMGVGLRELTKNGEWYDENNDLDDSEYPVLYWTGIPKRIE